MKVLIALLLSLAATVSFAARVGVVDSGVDFEHELLKNSAWSNPSEVSGNRVDDDQNGKVDDVNGWNFIDNYGRVFFREHLVDVNPISYKLMNIIAKRQAGTVSDEEMDFFKENLADLPQDQRLLLINHLNFFGQYLHGTHVAGIIQEQSPESQILAARVFPDEPAPIYNPASIFSEQRPQGIVDWFYRFVGMMTNGSFKQVASYLHETEMDVANYSLGMSLKAMAQAFLGMRGNSNPTEDEIREETHRIYKQFEVEGIKWISSSPNTLFVMASGNDGTDNDELPAFPANIRIDNAITVGASLGYSQIADFSNYGATTVDVMAPGVAINSTVPSLDNKMMLPMSGTSMAAPYVAGVAARIKDANPDLTPLQMKEILMGTVDKKEWLADKAIAGGIVNSDRAHQAALLSKEMELDAAIAESLTKVSDAREDDFRPSEFRLQNTKSVPLLDELASRFVF